MARGRWKGIKVGDVITQTYFGDIEITFLVIGIHFGVPEMVEYYE